MAYVKEVLASYYQQYVELLDKSLHQKNKFTDLLALVEQKTNVKRVYIAQGMLSTLGPVVFSFKICPIDFCWGSQ